MAAKYMLGQYVLVVDPNDKSESLQQIIGITHDKTMSGTVLSYRSIIGTFYEKDVKYRMAPVKSRPKRKPEAQLPLPDGKVSPIVKESKPDLKDEPAKPSFLVRKN
jgi:hypothetical protein